MDFAIPRKSTVDFSLINTHKNCGYYFFYFKMYITLKLSCQYDQGLNIFTEKKTLDIIL